MQRDHFPKVRSASIEVSCESSYLSAVGSFVLGDGTLNQQDVFMTVAHKCRLSDFLEQE